MTLDKSMQLSPREVSSPTMLAMVMLRWCYQLRQVGEGGRDTTLLAVENDVLKDISRARIADTSYMKSSVDNLTMSFLIDK